MVVQKEIDLKALQSVIEGAMQTAINNCEEVRINLIVAHDIVAIIKEEHKREIQDKLKPIPLPSYIGQEDAKKIAKIACDNAVLNGTKKNEELLACYGYYDENKTKCIYCKQTKECIEEKERNEWHLVEEINPECYGYYNNDEGLYCNNCKIKEQCLEETTKRLNK